VEGTKARTCVRMPGSLRNERPPLRCIEAPFCAWVLGACTASTPWGRVSSSSRGFQGFTAIRVQHAAIPGGFAWTTVPDLVAGRERTAYHAFRSIPRGAPFDLVSPVEDSVRKASVTIGTLLVVGAAVSLANCGGDDSSPTGGTGSGGSDATGGRGGSGGIGGSTGGSADTDGSSGAGIADSRTTGGSAGSDGSAGASRDASADGPGKCPPRQPTPGDHCNVEDNCPYGPVMCNCFDPGPQGTWACTSGPVPDGGGDMCPAVEPTFGDPCPDSGSLGPCFYDSGHSECVCDPLGVGWSCIRP
jgi:hypothetical protein